jgi:hypothetical protein
MRRNGRRDQIRRGISLSGRGSAAPGSIETRSWITELPVETSSTTGIGRAALDWSMV